MTRPDQRQCLRGVRPLRRLHAKRRHNHSVFRGILRILYDIHAAGPGQNEVPQRLSQPHLETCSPLRLHLPAGAVKSRCTVSIQVGTSSLQAFSRLTMQWQISAFFTADYAYYGLVK